jgi:Peptidase family M1 domain
MAAVAIAALAMARASAPSTHPVDTDRAVDVDASSGPVAPAAPSSVPEAASGAMRASASASALIAHADDVADYTLRASLDPVTHTVAGTGTIHFRNASTRTVSELWLHLYLNAFKNDRSAFLRERVGGRGSEAPVSRGSISLRRLALVEANGASADLLPRIELHRPGDDDETDARVPLPRDLPPGATIDLEVAFDDRLPVVIERTGYVDRFHMVGQWFPKIARLEPDGTWAHFPFHHLSEFYADFGTYDVTIDVPAAYTIGATGPAVETRVEGGRRIERHVQADVHDFAWTAWDRWQTRRETIDGVQVTALYPPGFDEVAERDLAALRFALPYESGRYGRYPYGVLTLVHPQDDASEAGGMEYPTLITSDGPWLTPKQVLIPEIVTVHELGHQWFYGIVATNEAGWPFLDEGINQFAETDAMRSWRGPGSAADLWGLQIGDGALQAVASNKAVQDEPVAQSASAFSSGANYARLVYSRTAAVLDTLDRVYGDDAVGDVLGEYTRRFRFQHPGPEQLLGVFEERMGARVAATLRAALFEKGWVDYAVDEVRERSVVIRRRGTLSFPVDVDLVSEDGSTRRERWDGMGDSRVIESSGSSPLRSAVVDPEERVTIDANLENNFGASPGGGHGAPRTLERALYWLQLAVQAVSP